MPRYLYTVVPSGESAAISNEPIVEQILRTEVPYDVGDVLPIGPGIWTIERVEPDATTALWSSEAEQTGAAAEPATVSLTPHCRVDA